MMDDATFADHIFQRLRAHLPPHNRLRTRDGTADMPAVPLGLNERMRVNRYGPGQRFSLHVDGEFRRSDSEASLFSVIIYLNDGFAGGNTRFHHLSLPGGQWEYVPESGAVLLYRHEGWPHEGCAVQAGRKYIVRTDVMFQASGGDAM